MIANELNKETKNNIYNRYPNIRIRFKEDHWFWRLMPHSLRITGTTIGNTIWLPKDMYTFTTLAHEYMHAYQFEKIGFIGFVWLYLRPQIFSVLFGVLSLLAFFFNLSLAMFVFLFAGLICLAPLPSPCRMHLELEGYVINLYLAEKQYGPHGLKKIKNKVLDLLNHWTYYKMTWDSKEDNSKLLDKKLTAFKDNIYSHVFKDINNALKP